MTDADGDATGGIALVGLTGSGAWRYSLDGTTFTAVLSVSDGSALLLPADAVLQYTPGGSAETATVTFRAWDGTSGTAGQLVSTTVNGGTTAFSTATDAISLAVTSATGRISGFVYIDADNDGLRVTPSGQSHLAMQSVVVRLFLSDGQGNWTQVSTVSSGADGSYSFDNLSPGLYQVREVQPAGFLDGKDSAGTVGGAVRGTVSQDTIQIQLGANENAVEFNFGERGLMPGSISLRNLLASAPVTQNSVTPAQTDVTPPSGYSIAADKSRIGSANAANAGFTFSSAEVGTTYNYSVSSSGGNVTVIGSGTITSASQHVANINVSSLSQGTLTFSVTLTDATGNRGAVATTTAILDKTAPSGYSVVPHDTALDETNSSDTFFQINGGEVGAAYTYSISNADGTQKVTGSGTIQSSAQVVSGVNVSGLPDGPLTFSVVLTDAAGNSGAAATAAATLDQHVPTGYSVAADDALISNSESAGTSITFAGAEIGTTYNYVVTSAGGAGQVTGTGEITTVDQQLTGINVSSLPDGQLTFSVTLTDAGGKIGAAVTATAILDRTVPSGYSVVPFYSTIDSTIADSFQFRILDGEPNTNYSYTITSDGGDGSVSGSDLMLLADYDVSNIDVSSLSDGLLTISLHLTDQAGNVGETVTATVPLDRSGT